MARIQRANVLLDVPDTEVDYYINLGYNLLDDKGNVIRQSVPTDIGTLRNHYIKSSAEIAELKSEIVRLQTKVSELEKETKKSTTTRKKQTTE